MLFDFMLVSIIFLCMSLCVGAKRGGKGETEDEGETDETSQKTRRPVPEGRYVHIQIL